MRLHRRWHRIAAVWLACVVLLQLILPLRPPAVRAAAQPPAPAAAATASEAADGNGIIVRYRAPAGTRTAARGPGLQLVQVPPGADPAAVLAQLRADPAVAYAEPNYQLHALAAPNDPQYAQQWGLTEINAASAWTDVAAVPGAGTPVTLAVVDTGVDATHQDLAGRILPGRNVIAGASDPTAMGDDSADGHGTGVAGIIAADSNNGLGIAGVAGTFPVSILPVKALDAAGVGTMFDVAQGIEYAADQGARVINLSLGARLPDYPQSLADAVVYAENKGAVVVAAAGNDGGGLSGFYPASLPGVVSVGASGQDHLPASFSDTGATLEAPGVSIETTLPGNAYGTLSGTSMAAPFVSGAAALVLSAYPAATPQQVVTSILDGQEIYRLANYQYAYVLDVHGALQVMARGATPPDMLQIVAPSYGDRVAGTVPVTARAYDPDAVARVDLLLEDGSSPTVVASVYGAATDGSNQSGLFTFQWDSTAVSDGQHTLGVRSYDVGGNELARVYVQLYVANHQATGLVITVTKPDGSVAAGAPVTVYHATYDAAAGAVAYETVWQGQADMQGQAIVPGSTATDGNDYLVITQGSGPNFLYYRTVRAPAQVTLDAAGAQPVTITGLRTDGSPLANAVAFADVLEADLPSPVSPTREILRLPLGEIGAAGSLKATMTSGRYDLRLLSADSTYYLVRHDIAVGSGASSVEFSPAPGDVATLTLQPRMEMTTASVTLSDAGDEFDGFSRVRGGQSITVTPGAYRAVVDAVYQPPASSTAWYMTLKVPQFTAVAGADHAVRYGPPLSAMLSGVPWHTGPWAPGNYVQFTPSFADADGNALVALSTGPPPALTTQSVVLRRTVGTNPSTAAFNPGQGAFVAVAQALTPVGTTLTVRDASGQVAPGGTYTGGLAQATWDTYGVPAGDYTATIQLGAGPLGPAATAGVATSPPFPVVLGAPTPAQAPLTVTVLDGSGQPVTYAGVSLLERTGGAYEPVSEVYTNGSGAAAFPAPLDPQGIYELTVADRGLFLVQPLVVGAAPQSVTIDARTFTLHQVKVQAQDASGQPLDATGFDFVGYAYDADGIPVPADLGTSADPSWLTVAVAEGVHRFEADQAWPDHGDLYHLVSPATAVTADSTIVLGGPGGSATITVAPAGAGADLALDGVVLFGDGLSVSPVFPGCGPLTLNVSAGSYDAEAALTHTYPDSGWTYWLTAPLDAAAGSAPSWQVDDWFTADIRLDATTYRPGEAMHATDRVSDGQGNRLVDVRSSIGDSSCGVNIDALGAKPRAERLAWRVPQGAPATTLAGTLQAQTHLEIAPFLVILDPSGHEIYRAKQPAAGLAATDTESTFFGATWSVPQDAASGGYVAELQLGAGPNGDLSAEAPFQVSAGLGLDEPTSPTNAASLTLTGSAGPGAQVALTYAVGGGAPVAAGTATAGSDGRFRLSVSLPAEGTYEFTATSGGRSASATLTVDRTPPGPPRALTATPEDQSHVRLDWTAPVDTDVASYRISRDGVQVGTATSPGFLDGGLQQGVTYTYQVVAIDQAGNASAPASLTATTSATGDRIPPAAPAGLTATAIPGGAHLTWQAATDNVGVAGYHVHRGDTVVGTVYGLGYDDLDLSAQESYTWTVTAFDAAGNESAPSAPASATTPPVAASALQWTTARSPNGLLVPGGRVTATLSGDPGRLATAVFTYLNWYDAQGNLLPAAAAQTATVPLVEISPGDYRGGFTLPQGTAELTAITGTLSDSAGHSASATATGLPLGATGALAVAMTVPATLPQGTRLSAWSATAASGAAIAANDNGQYILQSLAPASDYDVRVHAPDGQPLGEVSGVRVVAGLQSPVSIAPSAPSTLDVQVTAAGAPVAGVEVDVFSDHGAVLASGVSGADGWVVPAGGSKPLVSGLLSGQQVDAAARVGNLPYVDGASVRVTLLPGTTQADLALQPLPASRLEGTVTFAGGHPATGATISVVDGPRSGGTFYASATADDQGHYAIDLPAGTAWVAFLDRRAAPYDQSAIVLPPGGSAHLDASLQGRGTVTLALFARYVGSPAELPVPLDWRTAVHYQIRVTNLRTGVAAFVGYGASTFPDLPVVGSPGDVIQVSLDGTQAGLTGQVGTVTLDDNDHANLALHLAELGHVQASVRDSTGAPGAVGTWWADLTRTDTAVPQLVATPDPLPGRPLAWTGLAAGTYRAVFYWGTAGHPLAGADPVTIDGIRVQDGQLADLGAVVLPPQPPLTVDTGNSISADVSSAPPGSAITLRATYNHYFGQTQGETRLVLTVPAGASYVDGTAQVRIVSGRAGVPAVQGDTITMALTSPGGVGTFDAGSVTYQIRLGSQPAWPLAVAEARVEEAGPNGTWMVDARNDATIQVPAVSLIAPGTTQTADVTVSGEAVPDSTVTVYDGDYALGQAVASAGGFWRVPVTLADRGRPSYHTLVAEARAADGSSLLSNPVGVVYGDPSQGGGEIHGVTMAQTDGRIVTFDPRQGVALFPYVWVPGMPLTFQVTFADKNAVKDVAFVTCHGTDPCVQTPATLQGSAYSATHTYYSIPGDIYVTYDRNPQQWTLPSQPTDADWQAMLPEALRDATYTVGGQAAASAMQALARAVAAMGGRGAAGNAWASPQVTFDLGGDPNKALVGSMKVTPLASYTPAVLTLPAGSPPVYDMQAGFAQVGNQVAFHASFVIPAGVAQAAAARPAGRIDLGAADLVEMTWESAFSNGTTIQGIQGALDDGSGQYLNELSQILDQSSSSCGSPSSSQYYQNMADNIRNEVAASLAVNATLTGLSLVFSVSGVGLAAGLAFWAISAASGAAMAAKIESDIDGLKSQLNADPDCQHNPRRPDPGNDVGNPHWIVDPSGYVYEAVPSDRLSGVTATALQQDPGSGAWRSWDATAYGQENPLATDPQGRYGWDVPEGNWQITYSKPGYQPATSKVLTVPPPRTDVNVGLVSLAAPAVTAVTATPAFIQVDFDRYVLTSTLAASTVAASVYGGAGPVAGSVSPVDPQLDDQGTQVSRSVRIVPDAPLTLGDSVEVTVSQLVQSYAGVPMAADLDQVVTVGTADTTPPGEVAGLVATAGDRAATLAWQDPPDADLASIHIAWWPSGGTYVTPVAVSPGQGAYAITDLADGTAYDIRVTTLDVWGNESAGVTAQAKPEAPKLAAAGTGGGATPGGTGAAAPFPAAVATGQNIGIGGGVLTTADGAFTLPIPAGTVGGGAILTVQEAAPAPTPLPAGSRAASPVFTLAGATLASPQVATLRYEASALGGMDPGRLSVYAQHADGTWRFLPTRVSPTDQTLRVRVGGPVCLVVLAATQRFADVPDGHWAAGGIGVLLAAGVASGFPDGSFRPDAALTRAQFVKLLAGILGLQPGTVEPAFGDVPAGVWYAPYVAAAVGAGWIDGTSPTTFSPDATVTREEMALMLARALHLQGAAPMGFSDAGKVDAWAQAGVQAAVAEGLIRGFPDGAFEPGGPTTRAQAARVLALAIQRMAP